MRGAHVLHLLRSLAAIGAALVAMAALGALAGCGGGDPEHDAAGTCVHNQGSGDAPREQAAWVARCELVPHAHPEQRA
jgi:hypothetical protein